MTSKGTAGLGSWGVHAFPAREHADEQLSSTTRGASITRGLGRSYGDASFPPPGGLAAASRLADRLLSFDDTTGVLRAEAGVSLHELNRLMLPRGFFPPVTPGTAYVSLGGMVASDVHGKNHHVGGSFGRHVQSLKVRVADGRVVECSRQREPDLFRATLGGMGLTGHILEVECTLERVPSPWIRYESERISDIDAFVPALKHAAKSWPMTVGWIDCVTRGKSMGRGILIKGHWADAREAPSAFPSSGPELGVPFFFPSFLMNRWTIKVLNTLYYWRHWQRLKRGFMTPRSFFYPLDAIHHWNRVYGRMGMTQHQCVLPEDARPGAVRRFVERLTELKVASFVSVIKDCGDEGEGILSFPMKGVSIAVDIAVNSQTQKTIDALNEQVLAEGGRIYLTKDAFTRPEHFRQMERSRLDTFLDIKRRWDPEDRLQSAQYVRLVRKSSRA